MNEERVNRLGLPVGTTTEQTNNVDTPANVVDRWVFDKLTERLGNASVEVVLWDGTRSGQHGDDAVCRIRIGDRAALYGLVMNAALKFGDYYSSGRVRVDGDLADAVELASSAVPIKPGAFYRITDFIESILSKRRLRNADDNIHHHYDIGNSFYERWLDREAMQYTCAYYVDDAATLEAAQIAKMHHICRKLNLKPGETVVEAGCGWGGFARFMASHYDVNVTAFNISREQVAYARKKLAVDGLGKKVEYVLDDFRNISGKYDVFVSIGMLEHVGRGNYTQLGDVIDRSLKPNGRGLVHAIGRDYPAPANQWIERRIFPGSYPPTLVQMLEVIGSADASILDVENLRLHYTKTLRDWLARYEEHGEAIRHEFDEQFYRAWKLYLSGSIAAFKLGRLQVFQILFARNGHMPLPLTRERLYRDQG